MPIKILEIKLKKQIQNRSTVTFVKRNFSELIPEKKLNNIVLSA